MTFSRRDRFLTSITPLRARLTGKNGGLRLRWLLLGPALGVAVAVGYNNAPAACTAAKTSALKVTTLLSSVFTSAQPAAATQPAAPPAVLQTAVPIKAAPLYPADLNVSVQRGDTLMSVLMDMGVKHDEAYQAVESMKKVYNPKKLNIGQSLTLHLDQSRNDASKPSLSTLSIAVSPLKTIALARTPDDSFTTREIKAPVFMETARGGGDITSSLYQTGIDSGVPAQLLSEVINALSYDVDFQRDIKEGDHLDVVYERLRTQSNVTAGHGHVLYVQLTMGDKELTIYNHISPDGYAGYYNAKGESVKKALLKTPINGARITSGFGMRMHPLLGYSRMHKGVDFGAATGTPIYAAGDGVVEFAGRKNGYGNFVLLKHGNTYETAYGHASRFARGIHPGVHVKQGQVIAYVGMTGAATGPHLHYEIRVAGNQVNPSRVKFRTGQTLAGRELAQFKREVSLVKTALATLPQSTQLASLER